MPGVRLCVLFSGLLLLSCHGNRLQLEAINQGFETSTQVLEANCDTSMYALIHGSRDEIDQYRASRWQPIAAKATVMAIKASDYIDSLQKELKDAHKISDEQISDLFDTLMHFKQSLPRLFGILQSQPGYKYFQEDLSGVYASLAVLPGYPVSATPASAISRWKDSTFNQDEVITRLALTKLKHDLILSDYQLIQFIRREMAVTEDLVYSRFSAIAVLSTSVVKPGDTICVFAGIGHITTEVNPMITVGNVPVTLTESGEAIKTVKAGQKPGKYAIPVRLEYSKPDGSRTAHVDTLHYQIVAPCAP